MRAWRDAIIVSVAIFVMLVGGAVLADRDQRQSIRREINSLLTPGPSRSTPAPLPTFPAGRYAPTVEERILQLARDGDCVVLQRESDQAVANDRITRERTGRGTSDLVDFIDSRRNAAGCSPSR